MDANSEEEPTDVFRNLRDFSASHFNSQWKRLKNQDWWTFSKIWVAVSIIFIFISGIIILGLFIVDIVSQTRVTVLVSIVSILLALANSTVFYIVIGTFLASIAAGVAVTTGEEEVIVLEDQRSRYFVHALKIAVGITLLSGTYMFILGGIYSGIFQFIALILGITGFLLLPVGMMMWGVTGMVIEWKSKS